MRTFSVYVLFLQFCFKTDVAAFTKGGRLQGKGQIHSNKPNKIAMSLHLDPSFLDHTSFALSFTPEIVNKNIHALSDQLQTIWQTTQNLKLPEPASPALTLPVNSAQIFDNPLTSLDQEKGSLDPLGNDLLIFLCATIGIVPLFKWLDASPVIGFLSAGTIHTIHTLHTIHTIHTLHTLHTLHTRHTIHTIHTIYTIPRHSGTNVGDPTTYHPYTHRIQ